MSMYGLETGLSNLKLPVLLLKVFFYLALLAYLHRAPHKSADRGAIINMR